MSNLKEAAHAALEKLAACPLEDFGIQNADASRPIFGMNSEWELTVGDVLAARKALAQPDDGEKPVEAWHGDRKVSVYKDTVLRVWGPNIESTESVPRNARAVQDAFVWLYAAPQPPSEQGAD